MSIKLIALDLDDTLLDSQKRISPICIDTIRKARNQGVLVTLATGRMFRSAVAYARELEIDLPLITYQGALVKNSFSEKVLYYQPLPADLSREIMLYFEKRGIYYHCYFEDQLYVESITEENQRYASITGVDMVVVDRLIDLLESRLPLEILAVSHDENELIQISHDLISGYGERLNISRFKSKYLEILSKQASKVHALQLICEQYRIDRSEVMAVGDNFNDISMIRWAGLGVAMGNAYNEVKEEADYITLSNDEEGVAEAIRRFVLR